jgi:hypothetical protein
MRHSLKNPGWVYNLSEEVFTLDLSFEITEKGGVVTRWLEVAEIDQIAAPGVWGLTLVAGHSDHPIDESPLPNVTGREPIAEDPNIHFVLEHGFAHRAMLDREPAPSAVLF